jgi:hypothetical protein
VNLRRRFQSGADQENLLAYAAAVADLRQSGLALAAELRDHDHDHDHYRALYRGRARARELERALYRDVGRALYGDRDRDFDLDLALDLDFALDIGLDFVATRLEGEASSLGDLQERLQVAAGVMPESPASAASSAIAPARPAWVARRVHGWTARLLSPAARARFEDELLDELHELAEQNATGCAQLACALRQLGATLQLRHQARQDRKQVADLGGD